MFKDGLKEVGLKGQVYELGCLDHREHGLSSSSIPMPSGMVFVHAKDVVEIVKEHLGTGVP